MKGHVVELYVLWRRDLLLLGLGVYNRTWMALSFEATKASQDANNDTNESEAQGKHDDNNGGER